tara:strand:- start:430 stop:750 length:321 start_codon:yes stop_codon:yes gene_type:complete
MAKSPLKNNGEEIRDASEILGDQPGYNPNTNTIMQTGTVPASSGGLGSGQSLSLLGKIGAGIATGATTVAGLVTDAKVRKRYKESQEKWKKQDAVTDVYRSQGPKP